jgi:predicted helicase
MAPDFLITNEPARIVDCGSPDYLISKDEIYIGFIEAKDIGKDLGSKEFKEQFDRYRKALENLIITDYLEFRFYVYGDLKETINIGQISNGKIKPLTENFDHFKDLVANFCQFVGQTIKSSSRLSKLMAGKARMFAHVIENALTGDIEGNNNSDIVQQMEAFKHVLIHDIKPKDFADIYAQTIAYGMFAARLHDPTLENFSRQEAAELIPKTNPFLRKLFQDIAGYDLDDRQKWIVDSLADIFRLTDVKELLQNFGKSTQQHDPVIHFYETFLSEYDPRLRKSRGVWYTPEPVVNFIVRAVDDILKTEFGLNDGLADNSKSTDGRFHKVQILDPACGTGTFLSEVIKQIYKRFEGQQGIWSGYVEEHLIPRLNGFEILMAPYAMAHLKMDLLLAETGYKPKSYQRLKVYLTNALEEYHEDTGPLFSAHLANEAKEANEVKRDTPVMVVLGNPPYSGISSNMGEWISNLIEDYKYVDGEHFGERKHWLHDDYVKFIRYGELFIERNNEGVLAFICNNSFLDNPTFRGMRWHLLNTFDKIYIIDLHGSSKKKEVSPDGSPDKNVFDIQQGVSINIFMKKDKKTSKELATIYYTELFGKRDVKNQFLMESNLSNIKLNVLKYKSPYYFFVNKNVSGQETYDSGFQINKLFNINVTGIITARDKVVIDFDTDNLCQRMERISDSNYNDSELRALLFPDKQDGKYLAGDSRGWKLAEARFNIKNNIHSEWIKNIDYRPFDTRKIYYSPDMVDWGRENVMHHFLKGKNLGLMTCRQIAINKWEHVGITKLIADDSRVSNRSRERGYIFPLYLYSNDDQQTLDNKAGRTPNLNSDIVKEIEEKLGLTFTNEKEETEGTFAPIDILDYIYAVLHSPSYREKFKEFLKIDFPRIPYPKDKDTFWQLVKLGGQLREIHLLESPVVEQRITDYPVGGDNEVGKIKYKDNQVWINDEQYFDKVTQTAWEFYIGGYQPAQKWLKDRKGRKLSFDDIMHYQKIIVALSETDRLMKEIDKIDFM